MAQGDYIAVVCATAEGVARGARFLARELEQRRSKVGCTCDTLERAARVFAREPLAELSGCTAYCWECSARCRIGDLLDEGRHRYVELSCGIGEAEDRARIAMAHRKAGALYEEQHGACTPLETIEVQQAIQWCRKFWEGRV